MISNEQINKYSNNFSSNEKNRLLSNIISSNALSKLSNNGKINRSLNNVYNISVKPHLPVTNQKSSGRCWLFAALNVVRREMCEKYKLDNFEFSQSFLFFWDKFERMNYNMECIIKTKNEDVDSRIVQHLLNDPSCDGGQWDMITNLVNKYGLIPKSNYNESHHSSNSRELNMVLKKKFREYAWNLRVDKNPKALKEIYMEEVYKLLCLFLGEPPKTFNWEYNDKNKNYKIENNLNPLSFYKTMVPFNFDDYICVINDPRKEHPYYNIYSVKYLGNVIDGNKVKYLNLPISRIKELVLTSLKRNKSVWYGCDVGQFLNKTNCRMDRDNSEYLNVLDLSFNLNKEQRLRYQDSLMTHAMVITGANTSGSVNCLEENDKVNNWEVENSWSSSGPSKGYYSMSDNWFNEYVYEVAIKKDLLNENEKGMLKSEFKKIFDPWDPMGSLA
jgi:bleomycin hydrolase